MGIKAYLSVHPEITDWIVLDDEVFIDFKERGIMPHLVKTDPIWGLTDDDAEVAIKMLNGQIIGPYIAKSKDKNTIDSNDSFDYDIIIEKDAGPTNGTEK